jgi:hypothetical protein
MQLISTSLTSFRVSNTTNPSLSIAVAILAVWWKFAIQLCDRYGQFISSFNQYDTLCCVSSLLAGAFDMCCVTIHSSAHGVTTAIAPIATTAGPNGFLFFLQWLRNKKLKNEEFSPHTHIHWQAQCYTSAKTGPPVLCKHSTMLLV